MSVEQSVQGVASGNIFVQNAEELGSDICPNTRVPGRIKPELSPAPTSVLFPSVILIKFMNINFFVLEIVCVAAGAEGFLILGFALLKDSFIAGEHIESLVDIEGYVPDHRRGVVGKFAHVNWAGIRLAIFFILPG